MSLYAAGYSRHPDTVTRDPPTCLTSRHHQPGRGDLSGEGNILTTRIWMLYLYKLSKSVNDMFIKWFYHLYDVTTHWSYYYHLSQALPVKAIDDVSLTTTPSQVYDGIPSPLTLNCSHRFTQSGDKTLLSMILLKEAGPGNFTYVFFPFCWVVTVSLGICLLSITTISG